MDLDASGWVRITRTNSPGNPYSWRYTAPAPKSYTGDCGAFSFAQSRYLAELDHAAHMARSHAEAEGEQ